MNISLYRDEVEDLVSALMRVSTALKFDQYNGLTEQNLVHLTIDSGTITIQGGRNKETYVPLANAG